MSTTRIAPPSTASPSRWTDSITGNNQFDPMMNWPSHSCSHHSKKGSSMFRLPPQGAAGGTTQPATKLTIAGCGWMSQSNQL